MVVDSNKEDKQIKSVGYGGMLVARLFRMQMGFKSHRAYLLDMLGLPQASYRPPHELV